MTDHGIVISPATAYGEGLAAGELRFQRCADCDKAVFYPRVACPNCGSLSLEWSISSGSGVVYSTTTTRSRAGDYNVALIDLEDGYRMMCAVHDEFDREVRIGERVSAVVPAGTTAETLSFRRVDES